MRHVLILVLVLAGAQANAGLKLKQRVAKIYIDKNGKQISLGCFRNPEDAHKAYEAASPKVHGEFGRAA